MIKCCIFDLDGTLLNTLGTIAYYLNETLVRYGIASATENDTKRYIGDGARMLVERALGERGVTDPDLNARVLKDYKAAYDLSPLYLTHPYDGVGELLQELKERGVILAVLSNKPDDAATAVVEHFFPGCFDLVQGGMDGVPLKPDPTSSLSILTSLGVSTAECAFIGDTAVDIMTAKNMGAALSVGVLWGFRDRAELEGAGADIIAGSASDIISALGPML